MPLPVKPGTESPTSSILDPILRRECNTGVRDRIGGGCRAVP